MTKQPLALKIILLIVLLSGILIGGCTKQTATGECQLSQGEDVPSLPQIGCYDDFHQLSALPLNASLPGSLTVKTIVDRADNNALYFINTKRFPMHYSFAAQFLSDNLLPPVGDRSVFNQTEYFTPNRRFLLGALTYYREADNWVYEIAPYDNATAEFIETALELIKKKTSLGTHIFFHPTSRAQEISAQRFSENTSILTTDDIFQNVTYQPLNPGDSYGQLRFFSSEQLSTAYVGPRDVVIFDLVPNDISVVAGIITEQFQTPLSHVNVLSQNRGTPNMALHGAFNDPNLRSLENSWVHISVSPFDYTVEPATKAEADAWWEQNKPPAVIVPPLRLGDTELRNIETITLDDIPAYGGKAANFGALSALNGGGDAGAGTHSGAGIPVPKAFAVPVYYYKQFEQQNGFDTQIAAWQTDSQFVNDPAYRESTLKQLQQAMTIAPVDSGFEALLLEKLAAEYPGQRMRFRSSTNAEDLDGFSGAGLYSSHSGEIGDAKRPVLDAVRKTWASLWNFRAYEERTYNGIPQDAVAMALLVHHSFPDEEANGVALTANIFDNTQPAFYINVQTGENSVVSPGPGDTVDSFLYYHSYQGKPVTYLSHSNMLLPQDTTVLTDAQMNQLGAALLAIHDGFAPYYKKPDRFYAMDVEFKFDDLDSGNEPTLWIKQARPNDGWE